MIFRSIGPPLQLGSEEDLVLKNIYIAQQPSANAVLCKIYKEFVPTESENKTHFFHSLRQKQS